MNTVTISKKTLRIYAFIAIIVCFLGIAYPYLKFFTFKEKTNTLVPAYMLILILIACIFLHEIIHAFFFCIFTKKLDSVKLRLTKYLNPACYCSERIKCWQYRIVLIMPFIFLGITPAVLGYLFLNFTLVLIGTVMSAGAMADIVILIYSLRVPSNSEVLDLDGTVGFIYN